MVGQNSCLATLLVILAAFHLGGASASNELNERNPSITLSDVLETLKHSVRQLETLGHGSFCNYEAANGILFKFNEAKLQAEASPSDEWVKIVLGFQNYVELKKGLVMCKPGLHCHTNNTCIHKSRRNRSVEGSPFDPTDDLDVSSVDNEQAPGSSVGVADSADIQERVVRQSDSDVTSAPMGRAANMAGRAMSDDNSTEEGTTGAPGSGNKPGQTQVNRDKSGQSALESSLFLFAMLVGAAMLQRERK